MPLHIGTRASFAKQVAVEILAPSVLWLACAALLAFATLKDGTQPEGGPFDGSFLVKLLVVVWKDCMPCIKALAICVACLLGG